MSHYDELAAEFAACANDLDEAHRLYIEAAARHRAAKRTFIDSRKKLLACKRVRRQVSEAFTDRELEVIQCSLSGWQQSDIAKELKISVRTVKFHLANIFEKLNISSKKLMSETLKKKYPQIFERLTGQVVPQD